MLEKTSSVEDELKKIFLTIFPDMTESSFDWKKPQEHYANWDSFAQLQLVTAVESKFNIMTTPEDALSIKTAEDLLKIVKSRI